MSFSAGSLHKFSRSEQKIAPDQQNGGDSAVESCSPERASQFHLELLEIATSSLPEESLRQQLRALAIRMTGGSGAASVCLDAGQRWQLLPQNFSGRIAVSAEFQSWIEKKCSEVASRGNIAIDSPPFLADATAVCVPILQFGCAPECLVLFLPKCSDVRPAILILEQIAAVIRVALKSQIATQSEWKLHSLAALIELVSSIESASGVQSARLRIANELARHLSCPYVAVGSIRNEFIEDFNLSGARKIDPRSHTAHDFLQALQESLLREAPGIWPIEADNHLLLAHRQLAATLQCDAIYSHPLVTVDGKRVGALLIAGPREVVLSDRMQRFVATASPRIAGALDAVQRAEISKWMKRYRAAISGVCSRKGILAVGALLLIACLLSMPVSYRVRGTCTISPVEKRFAVAPYDGMIARGFVRPGDRVQRGEVLAEMDDRSLNIELSGISANHLKAIRKQGIELAEHNISNLQIAALEAQSLEAEESVLRYRQENLQIKSPIDGVILSGSAERAEASSVRQGQVLFEIGSLDKHRVEIEIPTTEIACVSIGQRAVVSVDGLESQQIEGTVDRIHSQAEIRNGQLVFLAEVNFQSTQEMPLYPGMRGSARIDGNRHPLGWNLFRRPFEIARSYFAW